MKNFDNFSKYLYSENKYIDKKTSKMSIEERRQFLSKKKAINAGIISEQNTDEILSIFRVGTIRDTNGEILKYYNLNNDTLIKKFSESKNKKIENYPFEFRKIKKFGLLYYYIPDDNIIFRCFDSFVRWYGIDTSNNFYWDGRFTYPDEYDISYDNDKYKNEERGFYLDINDAKTNKFITNLSCVFSYQNMCISNSIDDILNEDYKIFIIKIGNKEIVCRYIADMFIVNINNQKHIIKNLHDLELLILSEITLHSKHLNLDLKVLLDASKTLFNSIELYIKTDFTHEKEKEKVFLCGYNPNKY